MSNHVSGQVTFLSVRNRRPLFTGFTNIAYRTSVLSFDRDLARHKDVSTCAE